MVPAESTCFEQLRFRRLLAVVYGALSMRSCLVHEAVVCVKCLAMFRAYHLSCCKVARCHVAQAARSEPGI